MTVADRAAALVGRWVGFYTRHLPPGSAERRRAELASDLWEQRASGRRAGGPAFSMLRRMAAGAPADLRWRHEQLAAARGRPLEPAARNGWRALARGWWLGLAGLVALFEVVLGVATAGEAFPGAMARGGMLTAGGLLVPVGAAVRRRWRVVGDVAVAAGMLPAVPWLGVGPAALLPFAALTVVVAATFDATDARRPPAPDHRPGDGGRMLLGNAVVFLAVLLAYDLLRPELENTGVGGIVLILIGYIGLRRRRRRRST